MHLVLILMYDYNFKLERVVDADSLRGSLDLGLNVWLHNVDLRLFAIDAPETRSRDKMHKRHGLTAKKYVEEKGRRRGEREGAGAGSQQKN